MAKRERPRAAIRDVFLLLFGTSLLDPGLTAAQSPSPSPAPSPPPPMVGPPAPKAGDNPTGWTAKAGLSYVHSGGNSAASTLGFKFGASYNWQRTFFSLQGGGVQSSNTLRTSFAAGPSPDDFVLVVRENEQKTAENYFLETTLDRGVSARFFWQAGAGWLRNTFAGVKSREALRTGAGYVFTEPGQENTQLKAALLLTVTRQAQTIADPATDDTFIGARFFADLVVPLGDRNSVNSRLNLDENLEATDDFRMTWWNSVGFSLNDKLGLQVSLLLLYDNVPALQSIPVHPGQSQGFPVGEPIGTALVPVRKWDSELAVSFVLNIVPKKPAPAPVGAR